MMETYWFPTDVTVSGSSADGFSASSSGLLSVADSELTASVSVFASVSAAESVSVAVAAFTPVSVFVPDSGTAVAFSSANFWGRSSASSAVICMFRSAIL